MIDLRVMEEVRKNQRRSMAVGPYEDLPPHLRNHLVRECSAAGREGDTGTCLFLVHGPPQLILNIRVRYGSGLRAATINN